MAIPSRQIGWSNRANLLWQISKQLEYLTCVTAGGCGTTTTTSTIAPTTTTTTTIACECLTFVNEDGNLCFIGFTDCNGEPVETEILANETLQFCGCCGYADSELVLISTAANCIDGLCPGISTTTTTTTADITQCNYTIGQAVLGGKIAYILQPGDPGYDSNLQQGLVATVADISQGATWGCDGTLISGADGTAIGTGNQNTIDIMAGCATSSIAARLCGNLIEGGYSDWYLPSKDELNKLYLNRVAIGGFQLDVSGIYWSSTEYSNLYGWCQSFYNSATNGFGKEYPLYVRAIRAFSCTIPN